LEASNGGGWNSNYGELHMKEQKKLLFRGFKGVKKQVK